MATSDIGFVPRRWQKEILSSLLRFSVLVFHRRAGKTVLAVAKLIDSALKCNRRSPPGRFAYIAPLLKQAKDIAWTYLKQYAVKVPGTQINESELWVQFPNGARIRLYGADNPDAMRGLYFDGIVLDEVAQMSREVWGQILLPTLTDYNGWVIFIGTPQGINLFSEMYYGALSGINIGWFHSLKTCYETDVLSASEIELMRTTMTDAQFRQEMLCQFDASNSNNLISINEVNEAFERALKPNSWEFAPKVIGVDVAWQGGDRSCVFTRQGLCAFPPKVYKGLPEKNLSQIIASMWEHWKPDACFVDTTGGYGGEVLSRLHDLGYPAQGIIFSWKASTERFLNLRAEMWFKMAAWIKEGGSLPKDPAIRADLTKELCAPTYSNDNVANRFVLESKDAVRERIGVSPDLADSLALTFARPVMSKMDPFSRPVMTQVAKNGDFDPHGAVGADFDPFRLR